MPDYYPGIAGTHCTPTHG